MKLSPQSVSLVCAAVTSMVASSLFAATEATTDPVGFITMTVAGTSTPGSPKLSLVSPTLTQPILWQGVIDSINATTITVSGTPWQANQFNGANGEHYVEVYSATKAGALSDISGTATNSISTSDNLTAFGVPGDMIRIRKHVTLSDFLGANNSFGLLASDDPTTADEVLIYSGGNSVSYFYYTGSPGYPAGWYSSVAFEAAGNEVIGPNDGVVVRRRASGNVNVVFGGAVKTGNTRFPIVNGLNVVGTVSAQGLTLDNSNLYKTDNTALTASEDPTTGDEITIYTAAGSKNYFYYSGTPGYPAGWYESVDFTPAGSTSLSAGSAFVVRRRVGGPFNWIIPAPTSF